MIRPTRALRTSIMLSAVTLICIPAQAMAREQRAQPHAIPAASAQTVEPADPRTRVGRANAAARVEPERKPMPEWRTHDFGRILTKSIVQQARGGNLEAGHGSH